MARHMTDGDYVLGTQKDEVERLGLQHRVWLPLMLDAWSRAGIRRGQTIIDVGAGPGFATLDLAAIAGPQGKVIAFERSPQFLAELRHRAADAGLANIETVERDVAEGDLGEDFADAAWCRWLLSFVADPRRTVAAIANALKPGGVAVFHEYGDYGAWRMMPPNPVVDRFRALVMQSWRDSGGEPDIALFLSRLAGGGRAGDGRDPAADPHRPPRRLRLAMAGRLHGHRREAPARARLCRCRGSRREWPWRWTTIRTRGW